MGTVNKVFLIGNLGGDPEVRYTTSGQAVANFTLATTEVRVNDDEKKEYTEWHRVVAWGRLAEVCGEYLSKGRMVYIEGSLRTRSWEDKEGRKRWTTEVFAQNMQILSPAGQRGASAPEPDNEPVKGFEAEEELLVFDEVFNKELKIQKKKGAASEHKAVKVQPKKVLKTVSPN